MKYYEVEVLRCGVSEGSTMRSIRREDVAKYDGIVYRIGSSTSGNIGRKSELRRTDILKGMK